MSLRRKLILFFVAIVVLPVALLTYLLVDLSADSRRDRAESELTAGMLSVSTLYELAGQVGPGQAERIAERLARPLSSEDPGALTEVVNDEFNTRVIAAIIVRDPQGRVLAERGPELALSQARSPVHDRRGRRLGSVQIMTIDSGAFLGRIEAQTNRTAALLDGGEIIAATSPVAVSAGEIVTSTPRDLESFEVSASTGEDLGAALDLPLEPGDMKLLLLASSDGDLLTHPLTVIGLLVVLLIAALTAAAMALNRLRRRLNDMLEMTRRIGAGDFSGELCEDGSDEMAELAFEINRMRTQIASQMEELQIQRSELDESVRRLGEAFASGLDRDALFEVLIQTATTACRARQGQVLADRHRRVPTMITAGEDSPELAAALAAASEQAAAENGPAMTTTGTIHAMAEVMRDPHHPNEGLCVVSVARDGAPFTAAEQEALRYLLRQCAISVENIDLHEQVAKQAVTDDLTGLANHRALTAWIEREMQRVQRYGNPLSLLMIDIDEFKRINDTYGHPQGDRVLREVADVIKRESREVDVAGRYGGDEFVLALPGTTTAGAAEVAERIRRGIAQIVAEGGDGDRLDGAGHVSASLGVAGTDVEVTSATELIAAADHALYKAKAEGKDRVARATRA